MRVTILGAGGRHRTEASLARALRTLGHSASIVDALGCRRRLGRWAEPVIRWQVDRTEAELLLCTRHAIAAAESTLRAVFAGRSSAFWYFDSLIPIPEPVLRLARLTDRTFATYGDQVEELRVSGVAEVHFLPQGFDPAVDRPVDRAPARYRCDASFVGSGQYPRRYAMLRAIAGAMRLQIRGPEWNGAPADLPVAGGTVRGRQFSRVVRGAALSLGIDALETRDRERRGGTSSRLWRVLGSGGCFLGEYVDNIEEFARHGEHALWYRDIPQGVALARAALADQELRARIAAAGRAHALANHTYAHRLARLLAGQGYTST
jgi:hypothetical protein